jgi:ribose transport system substrate-binding protein
VVPALVVCALMSALAPHAFANVTNFGNLVRAVSTEALVAAGFTLVMVVGQLDLSIGATMTLGASAFILTFGRLGWCGAALAAAMSGALVGLVNGLLVTRARVNAFIVTLGTLTVLTGLTRIILGGGSHSVAGEAAGMAMTQWLAPVYPWSPRVLLAFGPVLILEIALLSTRWGRNFFLIGGHRETAWYAGINVDGYVTTAFVLSGAFAAGGGALLAAAQNTVMPNLGDKALMLVVAAVIVGGTSLAGGRGSVVNSALALFTLDALTNGLSYLGAAKSVKLVAHGTVLAAVVLADAWRTARRDRVRGRRRELLAQAAQMTWPSLYSEEEELEMDAQRRDRVAMVCAASVACTAMVLIFAMWTMSRSPAPTPPPTPVAAAPAPSVAKSVASADPLALKASDNQPLVWLDDQPLKAPVRPKDPAALPETDPLHWYDQEFSGFAVAKLPMPASPGTGPRGKTVISMQYMNHPYWQGYSNGLKRLAEFYGIDVTVMEAGNDNKAQMDQIEQVVLKRPDLVILTGVDAKGVVPMLKRLYDAKIPCISSNLIPDNEGMKYCLTWTGPDDWGQFRLLAREFAAAMHNEGGYAVVRHIAGTSCYFSRTFGAVSELAKVAPHMKLLDMQTTDLKTDETKKQVAAWLKTYGRQLKGIVSADDSKAQEGIWQALKAAGRQDVVCVAAGASRTGLEMVRDGKLHAITYQSAEADGALPICIAARWFSGERIDRPVYYLKKVIITKANVAQFFPPQW